MNSKAHCAAQTDLKLTVIPCFRLSNSGIAGMCPHTQLQRSLSEALICILHCSSDTGHLGHTLTSSSPARYHTNKNREAGEHNPVGPWDCCKENEQSQVLQQHPLRRKVKQVQKSLGKTPSIDLVKTKATMYLDCFGFSQSTESHKGFLPQDFE